MPKENSAAQQRAILIILDGFGANEDGDHNGVTQAHMPRLDEYFAKYPYTTIQASGAAVGLPEGQMGNSEVGHITMGCGNIIRQDLVLINDAINDGSFFTNKVLTNALASAKKKNKPIHLVGLVSDGGVHSHIDHLKALIQMCAEHNVAPALHMITDGRDTGPSTAKEYLAEVEPLLEQANGKIHTVCGRYYAMDRDRRWDRTELAWKAMAFSDDKSANSAMEVIEDSYATGLQDEFIKPIAIKNTERIESDDEVIFFNFRNDRPRQLCEALCAEDFSEFNRGEYTSASVVTMTVFHSSFSCDVAFQSEYPSVTLAEVVSKMGLRQLHCAETEKYPHVTFFINGGKEQPFEGEDRIVVPSPKVATYDLQPEMSAKEVADEVVNALNNRTHDLIIVNFANGDMVGHTAVPPAIIEALEVMDVEVGRVLDAAVNNKVNVVLTSDHGNCDEMVDAMTGDPHTQHTTNPVPCMVIDHENKITLQKNQGLSTITPTLLELMGVTKPTEMKASTLIIQ